MVEFMAARIFFLGFSAFIILVHVFFIHRGTSLSMRPRAYPPHGQPGAACELGLIMVARFLIVVLGSFLFVARRPNALAHSLMKREYPTARGSRWSSRCASCAC